MIAVWAGGVCPIQGRIPGRDAGPMSGPAAFAVLSQHVLRTLPVSLARRENLLRALVVFRRPDHPQRRQSMNSDILPAAAPPPP